MVLWDGACHVHEQFSLEKILELKRQYPGARLLVHPECKKAVVMLADKVGSTAALLDYAVNEDCDEFIVATESGILHEMQRKCPGKRFIPGSSAGRHMRVQRLCVHEAQHSRETIRLPCFGTA